MPADLLALTVLVTDFCTARAGFPTSDEFAGKLRVTTAPGATTQIAPTTTSPLVAAQYGGPRADPTTFTDPNYPTRSSTLQADRTAHIFISMGVVHDQNVGFKDHVALKVNKIPGGYCAPRPDPAIVLEDDLHLAVSFDVEFGPRVKPGVLPDLDAIPQPNVRRETSRNLTRIVQRQVASYARKRIRYGHPETVQFRQEQRNKPLMVCDAGVDMM